MRAEKQNDERFTFTQKDIPQYAFNTLFFAA
jgi:hypothetical protein